MSHRTTGEARANCFSCDRDDDGCCGGDQRFWFGDLAELIIYCEPLSDAQIQVVESYLRYKYAPHVNLGPDIARGYGLCDPVVISAGDYFVKYVWTVPGMNVPSNISSFDFYGSGTITVEATDIFGFTSVDEITVTGGLQNPFDDTVTICLGDDTTWNTGLSHNYDFLWQDGTTDSFMVMNRQQYYSVTVTDDFGCTVTNSVFARVDSFSATATLGADTSLCSENRIALIQGADEAVSYLWSDSSTGSTFTVIDSGEYELTAINTNGCVLHDTIIVDIYGVAPDADFDFAGTCFEDITTFTDRTTPPPPRIVKWNWDFGDGNADTINRHPEHFYENAGSYLVTLLVEDDSACFQNVSKEVIIYPLPVAAFTRSLINCANADVTFLSASVIPPGQSVDSISWTFGDGATSSVQHPAHVYDTSGIYPVSLFVTTDQGCFSAAYDTLEIFPEVIADFSTGNLCEDYPVEFFDSSPGSSTVERVWNFGDGSPPSTQINPTHFYAEAGTYTVILQIENAIGCQASVSKAITVTAKPFANFIAPSLCENHPFRFDDNTVISGNDSIVFWQWDFGDQSPVTNLENPLHAYSSSGSYTVRLDIRTRNGCRNSASRTATVLSPPEADFSFSPEYGAAPLSVIFTDSSSGAFLFQWNFGDDFTSSQSNPVHTYQENGDYAITLIASNLPGCSDTAFSSINVSIPTLDLVLDEVMLTPIFNGSGCTYELDMDALVMNFGTVKVTGFDITATASTGGTIVGHWTGEFVNWQTVYQFPNSFVIHDCDRTAVVCIEVSNPNVGIDQNPLNNRICVTLSDELSVLGPRPNPTGDFINLDIILPANGDLKITNYNSIGQRMSGLVDAQMEEGYHHFKFDLRHLSSGVYLLRVEFNDELRIIKYVVW